MISNEILTSQVILELKVNVLFWQISSMQKDSFFAWQNFYL